MTWLKPNEKEEAKVVRTNRSELQQILNERLSKANNRLEKPKIKRNTLLPNSRRCQVLFLRRKIQSTRAEDAVLTKPIVSQMKALNPHGLPLVRNWLSDPR